MAVTSQQDMQLSGPQKAAALLLAMGKENARRVTEHFSQEEMARVVEAAKGLPGLSIGQVSRLLSEFGENYERSGISVGAADFASLLGNRDKGNAPVAKESGPAGSESLEPDPESVKLFFETEPPAMCAVLLGELNDEMAARILGELEAGKRNQIVNAFLTRQPLDPELEGPLRRSMVSLVAGQANESEDNAQVEKTVSLITFLEQEDGEAMLAAIESTDPALAAEIRKMIFRFTDVDKLEARDIAQLADKLETDDIVAALSGAPESITEALMAPLSQRNRRIVESELGRGGVSEEKSDAARRKIAGLAVTLAKSGVITLPAG